MSYRNDHDAALYRVAALESELAQLRGERHEEKPAQRRKPKSHRGRYMLGVGVGAMFCVVGLFASRTQAEKPVVMDEEPTPSGDVAVLTAPIGPALDDDTCRGEIEEWAARDARAADPRGPERRSVAELMRGPIACGRSARVVVTAEEQNVSSLISVYYENDPVAMDRYQSAEQLWLEYHRARARR